MSAGSVLRAISLDLRPLRESRDFRLLWSGQLVSTFGRQISSIALPFQVYLLTGSVFAVGLLAILRLLPLVLSTAVAGVVADRVDRRLIIVATQLPRVGCSLGLAALALGHPAAWTVFGLAMAVTALGSFEQPARNAVIPNIVTRESLPGAMALNLGLFHLTNISGPSAGGVVIASLGLPAAYLLEAVTLAVGVITVSLLSAQPPSRVITETPMQSLRSGFAFVRSNRVILGSFVFDADAMVFGLPRALFPILALHVYHGGAVALGLLSAAPSVGGIAAILTSGWLRHLRRPGRVYMLGEVVWGVAIALAGLSSVLWPVLILLALAGAADAAGVACNATIMQLETPDHLRGRVLAAYSLVLGSGPYIGDFESGSVAALTSPAFSFVFGGAMCAILGLAFIPVFPSLWRYRRDVKP